MPVHDWRRVSAGTFHDFHSAWIIHLKEALNEGLLPGGYYALAEQHAGDIVPDVLTLQTRDAPEFTEDSGAIAVAVRPPKVSRKLRATELSEYRLRRRTLAIRHATGHRLVALVEIASPANKDRPRSVRSFVDKVGSALANDCHVMVVDLFPPGPYDEDRLHGAIAFAVGCEEEGDKLLTDDKPLTLSSYVAQELVEGYVEPLAVGDSLPDMTQFLTRDFYVNLPLERTYEEAHRGIPSVWRDVLEGRRDAP